MAFRFDNPLPQYFDAAGQVLTGGQLAFYTSGTTTPLATYTSPALTTANPNPLELDSTGRPTADIWLNGNYRVVLMDSTGATIWTRDNVQIPGGGAFTLPAMQSGQFLTNNGTVAEWASIAQVPSPAGASGKVLGTDGTNLIWQSAPSDGSSGTDGTNANVTVTPTGVKWNNGTGNLFFIQMGSGSAPASGIGGTSVNVTFPVPFATTPMVMALPTSNTVATNGDIPAVAIVNVSTTGFTFVGDTNTASSNYGGIITNPVPFNWVAFGTVAS